MEREKVLKVLEDLITENKELNAIHRGDHVQWRRTDIKISLDGDFTADELEAMALWMRAYYKKENEQ